MQTCTNFVEVVVSARGAYAYQTPPLRYPLPKIADKPERWLIIVCVFLLRAIARVRNDSARATRFKITVASMNA